MELRHLRYFVAVAEEENVSRAALKLHVSQPGVSRQIRDLEDEIGVPLFERGAQSLRLTAAGRTFAAEARALLQRTEEAVKNARAAAGAGGELHVGCAPSLTAWILPPALRSFPAEFPGVRVALHDLSTEEMFSRLREDKLQLALMALPGRKLLRGFDSREVARYPLQAAVAPRHPLAKLKSVRRAQLLSSPLVAFSRKDYPEYHGMLDAWFAADRRRLRLAGEHDSVTSVAAAVESGGGFALLPSSAACIVGPRLRFIPLAEPAPEVAVGAVWKRGAATEALRRFVAALAAGAKP